MAKIVLLSCTKSKLDKPAPAKDMYSPSPMFQTYTPPAPLPSQGQPQGGSGRTPVPSDVPSEDKPDVPQGGSTQGEDTGGEGDGDNAGGFKLSTPLLVLGAAAIYFFFFRKKQ